MNKQKAEEEELVKRSYVVQYFFTYILSTQYDWPIIQKYSLTTALYRTVKRTFVNAWTDNY